MMGLLPGFATEEFIHPLRKLPARLPAWDAPAERRQPTVVLRLPTRGANLLTECRKSAILIPCGCNATPSVAGEKQEKQSEYDRGNRRRVTSAGVARRSSSGE